LPPLGSALDFSTIRVKSEESLQLPGELAWNDPAKILIFQLVNFDHILVKNDY